MPHDAAPIKTASRKKLGPVPDCLNCDCTSQSGCKRKDRPTRKYVMKRPRGKRGPSHGATVKGIEKLKGRYS